MIASDQTTKTKQAAGASMVFIPLQTSLFIEGGIDEGLFLIY